MSSEHLHRPMPPEAVAIGQRYEAQINQLLEHAMKDVLALESITDDQRRQNDALSIAFELAAIAGAKAIMLLSWRHPLATMEQLWLSGVTDLQMRMQANLKEYEQQLAAGGTRQ